MKTLKKFAYVYGLLMLVVITTVGVTYAAFTDKASVLGATFSAGSADIKLLLDITKGVETSNLAEDLQGPTFSGIGPNWSADYLMKVYNNASSTLLLSSAANYETATDPDELRSYIYVEPFVWNDNGNGLLDAGELGQSYGKKTIVKWKTEGLSLGQAATGEVKALVLRFSTDTLPDTKQGKSGVFDFVFSSAGL
ncbi:MAG: hypothetical protein UX73_C0012G0018 [candidate division WWE3 bacterium GW2011_GWC1_47_10]|uniref:Camelysin metallo-endopeptidase n=1 Tax=candidate division WWE3 bacterium GW2011_GWC1_47_10 TaxID=1619122 RepID=A0A0G1T9K7_UNCKA|nr:MAG: hypothetical protein UX73_C0012G0018 [candidate division WWE3 bacterium GW2011_GWC1_47_10]